jgi:glycerophosphoryl diester phosphodiesterase
VQFLFKAFTEELIGEMGRYGMDIDVYYKALTEELVRDLHAKGFEINCWTVDDPEVAERLVSWGVDYITSNILE